MRSNLLIVDDHRVFCQGLEAVFRAEADFEPLTVSNPLKRSASSRHGSRTW